MSVKTVKKLFSRRLKHYLRKKHSMYLKRMITVSQFNASPFIVQEFIKGWKKHHYPRENELLDFIQCLEILFDVTRNYHKEDEARGWFNNIMTNKDSVIAWDDDGEDAGNSFIDSLYYEIEQAIKHLIAIRGESL